jgi:transglutaminase-like putative cysteine protease
MTLITEVAQPAARPSRGSPQPADAGPPPGTAAPGAPTGALGDLVMGAALIVLTLVSAWGFHRVFLGRAWVAPVVITALSAHVLSAALRRTRIPPVVVMAVCLAAAALVGAVAALGLSALDGFPAGTWHLVHGDLNQARAEFPTVVAPVQTTPGFDLLAAWGAGVIAVLGDWGTFRLRSAIQGAAPALALFLVSCVLGGPAGRTTALVAWLAAAVAYLLVHHLTTGAPHEPWFGGRRARSLGPTLGAGVAIGTAAILAAVAVTPALATRDGRGVLGWRNGPGAGGTRLVESPIVDLRTRIVTESNVPVFTVRSPVPDYWRLTSLDTFTGTLWESTDSYESVHDHLPGVSATPPGARTVVEDFRIQNLDSIWLPMAFNPESVVGGGTVTYDATSGSLLTNHATSDNLQYQVTSLEQLDTLNAAKLAAAGPPPRDTVTRRYLQLPSDIPAAVVSLAHQITAGDTTEYAKALALQNYLLGPSFTYSTDPPTDGYGTSALTTFLLDTKTGYCQQFAGAYAVMARIVGLPTRLAVGFATGTSAGDGTYHVTDADAHTWPEVDFPKYGWVPFEPTKGNFAIPGGDAYTGSKLGDATGPSTATSPPNRTTPATAPRLTDPAAVAPQASPLPGTGGRHGRADAIKGPILVAVGIAVVALLAWPGLNLAARRRRWLRRRRHAGRTPAGSVLVAWQEMGERLAWRGVPRRADETPVEYARRVAAQHAGLLDQGVSAGALADLARTVTRARYAGVDVPEEAASTAVTTASAVERALRSGAPWSLRLRWWLDPRMSWSGV